MNNKTIITIVRVALLEEGTFGVMLHEGEPFAVTGERPWKDNERMISCIPPGVYLCRRYASPRYNNTFEITDVPNRAYVLFHKGNFPLKDSEGCVLVAEQFEKVNGKVAVLQSSHGYGEFIKKLEGVQTFVLQIIEVNT